MRPLAYRGSRKRRDWLSALFELRAHGAKSGFAEQGDQSLRSCAALSIYSVAAVVQAEIRSICDLFFATWSAFGREARTATTGSATDNAPVAPAATLKFKLSTPGYRQ